MTDQARTVAKLPLCCDDCGLQALVNAAVDQSAFHVFENGVLCDDCYRSRRGKLP